MPRPGYRVGLPWAGSREIVLDTWDHILGEAVRQSVVVEGDRLWFWKDGGRWREFYRRVQ